MTRDLQGDRSKFQGFALLQVNSSLGSGNCARRPDANKCMCTSVFTKQTFATSLYSLGTWFFSESSGRATFWTKLQMSRFPGFRPVALPRLLCSARFPLALQLELLLAHCCGFSDAKSIGENEVCLIN
jgi:hypothetical protein